MTPDKTKKRWSLRGYQPPLLKPKAKFRVILAVIVNIAVFAAATLMLGYLRTGKWFDFSAKTFQADMASPTAEMFITPLGVLGHPWMIAVFAVLIGILTFVPLAVAVMYQLLLSLLLVIMIAVFGHCPFFALSLAVGCMFAARTSLRRNWPLGAMLLGMLPTAIFWYLFAYPGLDTTMLDAIQQWIIIVTISAALIFAVANSITSVMLVRIKKFQPGAIWPLLFIAITIAAGIFCWKITPAELQYQLLIKSIDNDQTIFKTLQRDPAPQEPSSAEKSHKAMLNALANLDKRREKLTTSCDKFLKQYPNSKRAASVVWLIASNASLQLDTSILDNRFICYTANFLDNASENYWQYLADKYPASDQAALAEFNLAILMFRKIVEANSNHKKISIAKSADHMLNKAKNNLQEIVSLQEQRANEYNPIDSSAEIPNEQLYKDALFQAKKLTWQIFDNKVLSDPVSAEAMAKFLSINPYNLQYGRKIKRLAADPKYANCPFSDNLKLAVAKLHHNPYDRAEAMIKLTSRPDSDTAIEANYELGRISMQTANARMIRLILKQPEYYFEKVANQRFSPWRAKAAKQLEWLEASKARQKRPTTQSKIN